MPLPLLPLEFGLEWEMQLPYDELIQAYKISLPDFLQLRGEYQFHHCEEAGRLHHDGDREPRTGSLRGKRKRLRWQHRHPPFSFDDNLFIGDELDYFHVKLFRPHEMYFFSERHSDSRPPVHVADARDVIPPLRNSLRVGNEGKHPFDRSIDQRSVLECDHVDVSEFFEGLDGDSGGYLYFFPCSFSSLILAIPFRGSSFRA